MADTFTFQGPGVAISCEVDFNREEGYYEARSYEGFRGTGDSRKAAALACFEAWVTQRRGWYEPQSDDSASDDNERAAASKPTASHETPEG